MPSLTLNMYDKYREGVFDGNAINAEAPGGNGIKLAVVTGSYTPNQNTHDFWDDVSASEVSGTGYTAGGNVLANGIVSVDGSGLVTVDFDDPAIWSQDAGGFTNGRRFVAYLDTGTAGTSRLIGYTADFGSDQGNVNGDFSATLGANGLISAPR